MADSVRERILKDIVTTLEGVTVANGYAHTLQSVQRFQQSGQVLEALPTVLVLEGNESSRPRGVSGGVGFVWKDLTVELVVIQQQDEATDPRPATEVMSSLLVDVQKAMLGGDRHTRGGHALDTTVIKIGDLIAEEGQPELRQSVEFQIQYSHRFDDPTAET